MSRTRILGTIATAALGVAMLGACSAESLTEAAVNLGLEQAIEGNEDINVDFGGDGSGGFSVSTDEGDFAFNFDEDNGGITFNTDEGDGTISFDADGIVYNTDAGDGTISFDEQDGTVSFDGDAGSGVIGTNQVPEGWPAAIGIPQTVNPDTMSVVAAESDEGSRMIGIFEHAPGDPYADDTVDALVATGWTIVTDAGQDGGRFVQLTKDDRSSATVIRDGATTTIQIAIVS